MQRTTRYRISSSAPGRGRHDNFTPKPSATASRPVGGGGGRLAANLTTSGSSAASSLAACARLDDSSSSPAARAARAAESRSSTSVWVLVTSALAASASGSPAGSRAAHRRAADSCPSPRSLRTSSAPSTGALDPSVASRLAVSSRASDSASPILTSLCRTKTAGCPALRLSLAVSRIWKTAICLRSPPCWTAVRSIPRASLSARNRGESASLSAYLLRNSSALVSNVTAGVPGAAGSGYSRTGATSGCNKCAMVATSAAASPSRSRR